MERESRRERLKTDGIILLAVDLISHKLESRPGLLLGMRYKALRLPILSRELGLQSRGKVSISAGLRELWKGIPATVKGDQ